VVGFDRKKDGVERVLETAAPSRHRCDTGSEGVPPQILRLCANSLNNGVRL
jgi:hypothetical protein